LIIIIENNILRHRCFQFKRGTNKEEWVWGHGWCCDKYGDDDRTIICNYPYL